MSRRVTETRLDVLAIGDAVVDVIATADDDFLIEEGLVKGSMQVLDADGATRLYARMSQARETSGGSAANTMAGIAAWAAAPASSARSPTTSSARSSATTSARSASNSGRRRNRAASRPAAA